MSTIRDKVKDIVRDTLLINGKSPNYRLGVVVGLNNDGSAAVQVDGSTTSASPLYPVVIGQAVILIYSTGSVTAVPTRSRPPLVPFEHPPYFTGGFIRILGTGTGIGLLQDAGNSNVYQILAPDLNPIATPHAYTAKGGCLSPDGTRCCVVWFNTKNTGSSSLPPFDVHYRVYDLGQSLQGTKTNTPELLISTAKMLFEVIRPLHNLDFTGVTVYPFNNALADPNDASVQLDAVCALDSDPSKLYWPEITYFVESTYTGGNDSGVVPPPLIADGTPMQQIQLFKYDNSAIPLPTTTVIGTWFTWVIDNFVFPFQQNPTFGFNKGISFPRAVFSLECVDGVPYANSIGGDLAGMIPAIVDPFSAEMVGIKSEATGTGCVASILPIDNLAGEGIHGTPPNTFTRLIFAGPDSAETLQTWDTGCQFLYLDSNGQHTLELIFPAAGAANGPAITAVGDVTYSRSDGNGPLHSANIARLRNFLTYIYQGLNRTTGNTGLDFVSVLYKDISKGEGAKAVYSVAKFTNSISGDPFFNHGVSSIQPGRGLFFMMKSTANGWFIDGSLHIRLAASKDNGATWTMDTDKTKFLKVSPSTDPAVDQTILKVFPTSAVSTL